MTPRPQTPKNDRRGQVIIELAIAMPIILFTILGAVEVGFLLITKAHQDRTTAMLAEWSAEHPGESWHAVAEQELKGCDVTVTEEQHDLIEATARCQYSPKVLVTIFNGLPMTSRETAAVAKSNGPSATPVASPSS
jgi:hypothetical protein